MNLKNISKINSKYSVILLVPLFLFSCVATKIRPGSERIRVFDAEPKGCIFVGEIPGVQESVVKDNENPEMNLETRIELRNKAHELGGNVLVFMKKDNKGKTEPAKKSATTTDDEVEEKKIDAVFLATVWRCPATILNQ